MNYKYTLEKYTTKSSRYTCPSCGKKNRFTRYIDTETGAHLRHDVGRCNREVKCGYHYKPKQYFEDNPSTPTRVIASRARQPRIIPPATISTHTQDELAATLGNYDSNHLVQFLTHKLGVRATQELVDRYAIGTHHHWQGSTVFWYRDEQKRICKGKLMDYNSLTGKRVKQPFPHITWMHSVLGKKDFASKPCFFGEHLLHQKGLPVCIVESEKTALIAAHHLPNNIWIATGGISSLNVAHCIQVLHNRMVTLFPDAGGYDKWKPIMKQLSHCNISPFVEYYHSLDSDDLADLLLCA